MNIEENRRVKHDKEINGYIKATTAHAVIHADLVTMRFSSVLFFKNKLVLICKSCWSFFSESLPNWWFVAHLTDLLYHCEMLKDHDLGYVIDFEVLNQESRKRLVLFS